MLWLTGCATGGSETHAPCPPVVDYTAADQALAADEVEALPEGAVVVRMLGKAFAVEMHGLEFYRMGADLVSNGIENAHLCALRAAVDGDDILLFHLIPLCCCVCFLSASGIRRQR